MPPLPRAFHPEQIVRCDLEIISGPAPKNGQVGILVREKYPQARTSAWLQPRIEGVGACQGRLRQHMPGKRYPYAGAVHSTVHLQPRQVDCMKRKDVMMNK